MFSTTLYRRAGCSGDKAGGEKPALKVKYKNRTPRSKAGVTLLPLPTKLSRYDFVEKASVRVTELSKDKAP